MIVLSKLSLSLPLMSVCADALRTQCPVRDGSTRGKGEYCWSLNVDVMPITESGTVRPAILGEETNAIS